MMASCLTSATPQSSPDPSLCTPISASTLLPFAVQQAIELLEKHRAAKLKSSSNLDNIISVSLEPAEFRLLSHYLWGQENEQRVLKRGNGANHSPDLNTNNKAAAASPSLGAFDPDLGAYLRDEVAYSYCFRQRKLEIRIPSIFHDTVSCDVTNIILDSARAAARRLPEAEAILDSLEVRQSPSANSYLVWDWDDDDDEDNIKPARKFPDGAIGLKAASANTLIVEVDFSNKEGPDKVNEFLTLAEPHDQARTGIIIDIDYMTPAERLSHNLSENEYSAKVSILRQQDSLAPGRNPCSTMDIASETSLTLFLSDLAADAKETSAADFTFTIPCAELAAVIARAADAQSRCDKEEREMAAVSADEVAAIKARIQRGSGDSW
ncbi:hypothetical protein UCRPA7_4988 [Phaeoacremonium minimum UCRPA7]|uniref:Uncharacterized protein n=1 Tax=Phaeoacremonium minimum (strain UCR-PA7) TaxID=1286976 RepID=R8BJW0_PHAM7|nr:hypothetical protein UCRPA7_4988 [Phaeoacremonium minimum UCRPA7]EON99502.1 hypothetical protein UCRPA7_4988 [Phaeoacremonium minimum UCRPA7]